MATPSDMAFRLYALSLFDSGPCKFPSLADPQHEGHSTRLHPKQKTPSDLGAFGITANSNQGYFLKICLQLSLPPCGYSLNYTSLNVFFYHHGNWMFFCFTSCRNVALASYRFCHKWKIFATLLKIKNNSYEYLLSLGFFVWSFDKNLEGQFIYGEESHPIDPLEVCYFRNWGWGLSAHMISHIKTSLHMEN